MSHTPTPWNASDRYVFDKEGNCIVICDTDNATPKRMAANAAFIAKAGNAHADLVTALKEVLEIARRNETGYFVQLAEKALAKAGVSL